MKKIVHFNLKMTLFIILITVIGFIGAYNELTFPTLMCGVVDLLSILMIIKINIENDN